MLCLNDIIFILNECKTLADRLSDYYDRLIFTKEVIMRDYPDNVRLNALFLGNKLFCKVFSLDKSVKEYSAIYAIKIINVNQGYSRRPTAVVVKDSAIIADETIYNVLN